MPSYIIDKYVQGSYCQSHPKYGHTAGIQCACNALLAICWAKVRNIAYWQSFDLDHVLDLGDSLYKNLGLNRYLDASDLPQEVGLDECFNCKVNKIYLHDGEAVIGRGVRFILNAFGEERRTALLFINSTVTAIILQSRACYFFDSHSKDSRGLSVPDGSSVLLKFANILQLENYIQVAHLEYHGRESQYFQLQFVEIEVNENSNAVLRFDRLLRRMRSNCISVEQSQNLRQNSCESNVGKSIYKCSCAHQHNVDDMKIDFHRYQFEPDDNNSDSSYCKLNFTKKAKSKKTDQKSGVGNQLSKKRKQQMCDYSRERRKRIKSDSKIKHFQDLIKEGP